ncbi:MAG: 30S ribosomal protein S6 [Propionibacteriaceae bacterium]|jgi:small subunit ribosomal protein S6|nr:30S ribosomal protein S6 [Propionibacteriaceae bacterium]
MRKYEIMVIIDPEVDDRQVQGLLDKPLKAFAKNGGVVDSQDIWGRRKLAYPINKKSEGIYAVLDLTAEPSVVKELDRQFTLNEQIMRTKVIRPDTHQ